MSYFQLPIINNELNLCNFDIKFGSDYNICICKSLYLYLNKMKKCIDSCQVEWDIYKKYTNTYEYVHTQIPFTRYSVCKYKPLSRSFYKLIEIINILNLLDNLPININTFHLAEGPGGFIEAISWLRNNKNDKYIGFTLISDDINVPGWKKSTTFLEKNENVFIEKGSDKKGDILNVNNLLYCLDKYRNTQDIVTGDAGFDFSTEFNEQEVVALPIIFAQIAFNFAIQKKGGLFILKIFDIFTEGTIDLIYILNVYYEKVYITKPNMSRIANSERYLVCINFLLDDSREIVNNFSKFYKDLNKKSFIQRFLNVEISYLIIVKLEEFTAILGQQQIENIVLTLNLIENKKGEKIENIKKNNIQKCIQWCIKNKFSFNKILYAGNINSFIIGNK